MAPPILANCMPGISRDVAHVRTDDSALVVYFTANMNDWATNHGPDRFNWMSLARRTGAAALLIRDRANLWYTQGIEGLESVEAIADLIRTEAQSYDMLITVGSSMGGYASLLYGVLADADLAIALVPQVRIGRAATAEIGEFRYDSWFDQLDALSPANPIYELDRLLPGDRLQAISVVGERLPIDVAHQNLLPRHERIADIRLDTDHDGAPMRFFEQGVLRTVIEQSPLRSAIGKIDQWIDHFSFRPQTTTEA